MDRSWKLKQKEYFNEGASSFDTGKLFLRENRNHIKKIEKIADELNLSDGDLILEVGTGTGIHARWLIRNKKINYVGMDLSKDMLKNAKDKLQIGQNNTFLLIGDAEKIPFKDNVFDAAFCSGTLHHASSPQKVVNELVRVIKSQKYVVIMEPNWLFPTNFIAALSKRVEKNALKMRKKNLKRWGIQSGLKELKVTNLPVYTPPFPLSLTPIYDLIDLALSKIPIISSFSIMIFLVGKKMRL